MLGMFKKEVDSWDFVPDMMQQYISNKSIALCMDSSLSTHFR